MACAKTNQQGCGWDYGLLRAIRNHQARERRGFHVTEVIACLRKGWYATMAPRGAHYPSESAYTFIGTMTHEILNSSDHTVWTEMPLKVSFGGHALLGQVDAYYPETGRIVDYKTARSVIPSRLPYGEHDQQVRVYGVMLRKLGLKVESAAVQYLDLNGPSKCKYCKTGKLEPNGAGYTCTRCGKEWDDPNLHSGAVLCEIPLGDLAELEATITSRLDILATALATDVAPAGEPGWLCSYCPFQERCPDAHVR